MFFFLDVVRVRQYHMNLNFECIWHLHLWFADVAAEKTQKSLFDGIEKFDATRLKHTETQEKNPLPDKDGMICLIKHPTFCTSTYMHADAQRLFNLLIDYTFICQNNIFRNFIALNLTILSMPLFWIILCSFNDSRLISLSMFSWPFKVWHAFYSEHYKRAAN